MVTLTMYVLRDFNICSPHHSSSVCMEGLWLKRKFLWNFFKVSSLYLKTALDNPLPPILPELVAGWPMHILSVSELHPVSTDRPSPCLCRACTPTLFCLVQTVYQTPLPSVQAVRARYVGWTHRPIKWVKLTIHDHQITDRPGHWLFAPERSRHCGEQPPAMLHPQA